MQILNKRKTLEGFKKYIKGKNFQPNNPYRLILHHTWKPTEKDWNGQTTINALKKYYEGLGWSAGPHIFIAPDGIWLFTDMKYQGIHAGEGNYRSIGIEVVGNYDGAKWSGKIKEQAIGVIKALMDELKIKDENLCFHRDFSSKTCPGKAITKEWILEKIKAPVSPPNTNEAASCTTEPLTPVVEPPVAPRAIPELGFEIHEDGAVTNITNSNQNIWDKLLNELKNLLEWLKSLK